MELPASCELEGDCLTAVLELTWDCVGSIPLSVIVLMGVSRLPEGSVGASWSWEEDAFESAKGLSGSEAPSLELESPRIRSKIRALLERWWVGLSMLAMRLTGKRGQRGNEEQVCRGRQND